MSQCPPVMEAAVKVMHATPQEFVLNRTPEQLVGCASASDHRGEACAFGAYPRAHCGTDSGSL